jgi:hypothetical protein
MTQLSQATSSRLIARSSLSVQELEAMRALLERHFEGVTAGQFERDIREKNWVILLERGGSLVGFSTILAYRTVVLGEPVSVVYSGDTIVDPQAWGSPTLARAWIRGVAQLREYYPDGRFLWLLIVSGFRTYRFLPVFWRDFFPRRGAAAALCEKRLVDELARERFGCLYDADAGVVRLSSPQILRGQLAQMPAGRSKDPDVRFFLERNPGHAQGDELVCLTELSPDNLTLAGRRMTGTSILW